MPFTYSRTFRVRYYECDAYGHLNNANYLRYMQETAFDASAAAGYDLQAYEALGHFWLIRETDIEYRRPLRYDDSVTVTQSVTVAEDQVLAMVEVKATRNGRSLHNHAAFLSRFAHGRIAELWMVDALPSYSDEFSS